MQPLLTLARSHTLTCCLRRCCCCCLRFTLRGLPTDIHTVASPLAFPPGNAFRKQRPKARNPLYGYKVNEAVGPSRVVGISYGGIVRVDVRVRFATIDAQRWDVIWDDHSLTGDVQERARKKVLLIHTHAVLFMPYASCCLRVNHHHWAPPLLIPPPGMTYTDH